MRAARLAAGAVIRAARLAAGAVMRAAPLAAGAGLLQPVAPSRGGGMADATDSKSVARKGVWVRLPSSVLPAVDMPPAARRPRLALAGETGA